MNEKKLKEKTKTELIRIIFELQSERDALKADVQRAREKMWEAEEEAWMYRELQK